MHPRGSEMDRMVVSLFQSEWISSTTDWSYASYSSALRSIVEADAALIVSANRGNNNLYLEGSSVVICGQLEALNDVKLRTAIGLSSSQSYVYVVADKKTGEVLSRLAERTLPVKQSYSLAKLVKAVNGEFAIYEGERIKLCEKYGTLNREQMQYDINDWDGLRKDMQTLESQEVELDVKPIDISNLELSAQDIINIEPFIEVINDD